MDTQTFDAEIERNSRFNLIVNSLDGILYWSGMGFMSASIILPVYVSHFTSSALLIGLIPFISGACYLVPQLFTSNWASRLPRKKYLPVNVGFYTERLPLLLLPLSALFFARSVPGLALTLFFIFYAWHATGAGIILVGWQDMIARVIPLDRRGRFFGITNFGGTVGGILGAFGVAWMLARFPFPTGYVLAFGAAGLLIFGSWLSMAQTREPAIPSSHPRMSQLEYLRTLPVVVREDHNFRRLLIAEVALGLSSMGTGFVMVYAAHRWSLPDSLAGNFTMAMLIGQALTNLWIGPLADRVGHKLVLELMALFSAVSYLLTWISPAPAWFYAVFAVRGASMAASLLSGMLIAMEFSEPEKRPTYIGLNGTVFGVAGGVAPLLGGGLALVAGYPVMFVISAVVSVVAFILLRWTVREPRHVRSEVIPSIDPDAS